MKSLEMQPEPMGMEASRSSFPSFYVCDEQMAEIADWEPEKEYTLTVKVRMASKNQTTTMDGIDTDARFDMLAYEVA